MPAEPLIKRAVSFIDGQNLYHSARESFGYTYPNHDVVALSRAISQKKGYRNPIVELLDGTEQNLVPPQSDNESPALHCRKGERNPYPTRPEGK